MRKCGFARLDVAHEINRVARLVECASLAAGNKILSGDAASSIESVLEIALDRLRKLSTELESYSEPDQSPST
jgi:hypothetical protein